MRASWHIALNGLWARRGRSALLAGAVLLASSLVVAVACGIGSVRHAVDARLTRLIGATDARIIDGNGNRFDAAVIEDARTWPGVQAVGGRLFSSITVLNPTSAGRGGVTDAPRANLQVRGIDLDTLARFGQVELTEGRLPQADDELVLDPIARRALSAQLGDRLRLQRFGAPTELTVVGFHERPVLGMMQRPEAVATRGMLEQAADRVGEVSVVSFVLEDGVDVVAWCREHQPRLPEELILEPAELVRTGFNRQVQAGNLGFLLASVVAFMSCAFIVATGMTTAVVEQERAMAVLRCIGAGRGQLFAAQVVSGTLLCAVGGAAGVPVGLAMGWMLVRSLREWLPNGLAVEPLGIGLAVVGSLAAGLAGSVYPAWRATRVSPLAALAIRAAAPERRAMILCVAAGVLCIGLQLALLALPDVQHRFWAYAIVGLPLLHIGWFMLSPPLLALVVAVLGRSASRVAGLPPGLLVGALRATPFRAGFTAGALMVGVSILVSTWSNGLSLTRDWFERVRFPDGMAFRVTGLSTEEQDRLRALDAVVASSPVGYLPLRVVGEAALGVRGVAPPNVVCVGVDPRTFFGMNVVEWKEGRAADVVPRMARGEGVLVAQEFLEARGLGIGSTIRLASGSHEHEFPILGVISSPGLDLAAQWFGVSSAHSEHAMSVVAMDAATVKRLFGSDEAKMMLLDLDDAVDDDRAEALVSEAVPGAVYRSGRALRSMIAEIASAMLATTSAVAFGALVLGCFGVGNVIAAGVHARRYEFGVLRAVGGGAWLPVRLVCAEAALMGVGGTLAGTGLGLHLAWVSVVLHRDLVGLVLTVVVPTMPILAGLATTVGMAVLAALLVACSLRRRTPRELLAAKS